jgi:hypothetical protein
MSAVDATYLAAQHIVVKGDLVSAQRVIDKVGEHVLVLSRKSGPSPSRPAERKEYHELNAVYYGRKDGRWKTEWTVHDMVDCPTLDSAAEFFTSAVSVTDLNGDGRSEVTIPYRLFCGGGIDYSTVKVILREGGTKLAIRGELEMYQPGGNPALQGKKQYDSVLAQPANNAYKQHLDAVWARIRLIRQ